MLGVCSRPKLQALVYDIPLLLGLRCQKTMLGVCSGPKLQALVYDITSSLEEGAGKQCSGCALDPNSKPALFYDIPFLLGLRCRKAMFGVCPRPIAVSVDFSVCVHCTPPRVSQNCLLAVTAFCQAWNGQCHCGIIGRRLSNID